MISEYSFYWLLHHSSYLFFKFTLFLFWLLLCKISELFQIEFILACQSVVCRDVILSRVTRPQYIALQPPPKQKTEKESSVLRSALRPAELMGNNEVWELLGALYRPPTFSLFLEDSVCAKECFLCQLFTLENFNIDKTKFYRCKRSHVIGLIRFVWNQRENKC